MIALRARFAPLLRAGRVRLGGLQSRERMLVQAALGLLLAALCWSTLIAPAWQVFKNRGAVHAELDQTLVQMHALAQEASTLQTKPNAKPKPTPAQTQTWVAEFAKTHGKALRVTAAGERLNVQASQLSADGVAQILVAARVEGGLTLAQLNLRKDASTAPHTSPSYSGTWVWQFER